MRRAGRRAGPAGDGLVGVGETRGELVELLRLEDERRAVPKVAADAGVGRPLPAHDRDDRDHADREDEQRGPEQNQQGREDIAEARRASGPPDPLRTRRASPAPP